jgi:hypothetical protein
MPENSNHWKPGDFMKRRIFIFVCAVASFAMSGCLKVKQLVVVNPDGSGSIVVSTAFPPDTVAMMSQMSALQNLGGDQSGASAAPATDIFYNEDQLRDAAAQFGEGVTLQKSEKIEKDGTRGAIAVYEFKDISRVKLNTRQNMQMGEAMTALKSGVDASGGDFIRFAFAKGDPSRLTILMPQFKSNVGQTAGLPSQPAPSAPQLPPELAALGGLGGLGGLGAGAGAMTMQMFKGMEISFAVQVKGNVIKSNASQQDGEHKDRFILLGMKFDELMNSPEFQKIANENISDQGEMMKQFFSLPGAHLETNREVIIEFK